MKESRVRFLQQNMDLMTRRDRIFVNNPVVMQGLGLAPIVIPASTVQNALVLAFAVLLLLTPTRMIATFIGQRIGGIKARAVTYVLTAGIVYIGVAYLTEFVFGTRALGVGIYLPLLVMEPLIIKRYASPLSERLSTSFKKGMITTIGFTVVLLLMAALRELLAYGTFAGIEVFRTSLLPMAALPVGGFILLGIFAAAWRGAVALFRRRVEEEAKRLNE